MLPSGGPLRPSRQRLEHTWALRGKKSAGCEMARVPWDNGFLGLQGPPSELCTCEQGTKPRNLLGQQDQAWWALWPGGWGRPAF